MHRMSTAEFVDADTWAAARSELLAAEKQLTAERDALACAASGDAVARDHDRLHVRRSRRAGHASPTCSAMPTNSW